ncbi:cation-translocating P-type ATPase [[Mycoplasma] collis]|uniref:cation-translocating P-type ATPase n=1 Tax=[Mycoplasma] collis TaxID=2127 RepID=UPI000B297177|nr:cation-translocating P-type ATPase [[Mycoplasma] collis]
MPLKKNDLNEVDLIKGLTEEKVKQNQQKYGYNKLKNKKKELLIVKFLKQFIEPLIILLIISSFLALSIAIFEYVNNRFDNKTAIIIAFCEPFIILFIVVLNAIFGFVQENKAEKSFEALKKLSDENARVIRDGKEILISVEQVTIGDIFLIETGDKVPAGGIIINSFNLEVNEAILTGESEAISKINPNGVLDFNDDAKRVFAGTLVTKGRAKVISSEIGMETRIGQIANLINNEKKGSTPLQRKIANFSKKIAYFSIILCILTFFIYIYLVKNGNWSFWSKGIIIGVTLAIGSIPEGLVPIITMILSISSSKLAKKNALIKRISAAETLGSVSVVCSDKTGTLTQNKMTVQKEYVDDFFNHRLFLEFATLATNATYFKEPKTNKINYVGNPTEIAIVEYCYQKGTNKNQLLSEIEILGEIPFESERKLMTIFIKKDNKIFSITKGAPDVLFKKINNYKNVYDQKNDQFANNALRVIAFAFKEWNKMPNLKNVALIEKNLTFIGLLAMNDPPRENVKESIIKAQQANIQTQMITGDNPKTAKAIAKELNIINNQSTLVVVGNELDEMSDEELGNKIENIAVFARTKPEHKIRIVKAWQKKSKIVAMTGDGVNDAPALKASDIGCAMGITGTDVSKNAADLVLIDDNFSTIITGIKEGRGILYSIRKLIIFLLTTNLSALLITIFGILVFNTNPLSALQILWINVVAETFPGVVLGLNRPNHDLMKDKPSSLKKSILTSEMIIKIVLLSIIGVFLSLMVYYLTAAAYFDNYNISIIKNGLKNIEEARYLSSLNLFVCSGIILSLNSFIIKDKFSFFSLPFKKQKWALLSFLISLFFIGTASYSPVFSKIFDMDIYIKKYYSIPWIIIFPFAIGIIPFIFAEIYKNITYLINKKIRNKTAF